MGKTRNLFKKIGDIKENFHASLGMIKDRKNMNLTEAEEIEKRSQEQTRELYKKDLNDADNHNGVVTHLEPDILECEVKWVLEIITMGFPCGSAGKESACNWGDLGSIPGLGRSGEGKGYPLQYSGLENSPMSCPWGHKELDTTEQLSLHFKLMEVM